MTITWNAALSRFEVSYQTAEFQTLRDAGFELERKSGILWTKDHSNVENLRGRATIKKEALGHITNHLLVAQLSVTASHAQNAEVTIPCPLTESYMPFQKAGIAYASQRPDTLFGDEMGLGKTIQMIGTLNLDPLAHRVLIICPDTIKRNWRKELWKWDTKKLSIALIEEGRVQTRVRQKDGVKYKVTDELAFPTEDVVIINYDLLDSWREQLRSIQWDAMLVDECHYLKNPKTGRTVEVFGCSKYKDREEVQPIKARRRLFASGTPLVNRPSELWPMLRALDPQGLGRNKRAFEERYCDGHMVEIVAKGGQLTLAGVEPKKAPSRWVWEAKGATNLEELQYKMRSRFMVRRLKADVLKELPAKRRQVIVLSSEGFEKILAKERKTFEQYKIDIQDLDFESPKFAEIARIRQELGVAMIPSIIEHVKEVLDEQQKVIVFVHHHEVVDGILDAFRECGVSIDGRTPNEERQAAVERFQNDPDCRVFVGSIRAAGVGITLTAASTVVFGEEDWVPGNITQAEDRAHRIGQTEKVLIRHLVLENSLTERMVQLTIEKQEVADKALDKPKVAA